MEVWTKSRRRHSSTCVRLHKRTRTSGRQPRANTLDGMLLLFGVPLMAVSSHVSMCV